jgi:hypothetical protein
MRGFVYVFIITAFSSFGQSWEVKNHPNNRRKAIVVDSILVSDFVYTEVSELSENKAYVAQGELYAYINKKGEELTPYIFAVANNFENGYAVVGDSAAQSVINERMQLIVPLQYLTARLPIYDLIVVQSYEGTWGVFDVQGSVKLPCIYDIPPHILTKDIIIVRKEEDYGVVNDCNEEIHKIGFQYISPDGLGYKSGKYLRLF